MLNKITNALKIISIVILLKCNETHFFLSFTDIVNLEFLLCNFLLFAELVGGWFFAANFLSLIMRSSGLENLGFTLPIISDYAILYIIINLKYLLS